MPFKHSNTTYDSDEADEDAKLKKILNSLNFDEDASAVEKSRTRTESGACNEVVDSLKKGSYTGIFDHNIPLYDPCDRAEICGTL
jgi:hypothetical protein